MMAPTLYAAWRALAVIGLIVVWASTSSAQAVAKDFDQLQLKVKKGDTLFITTGLRAAVMTRGWCERTDDGRGPRLTRSATMTNSSSRARQQREPQKRSWIGRHPVLFGTMVGFGAGFLIGYLPGDDGVFDDFTAEFNGLVLGGAGAGLGAMVGAFAK